MKEEINTYRGSPTERVETKLLFTIELLRKELAAVEKGRNEWMEKYFSSERKFENLDAEMTKFLSAEGNEYAMIVHWKSRVAELENLLFAAPRTQQIEMQLHDHVPFVITNHPLPPDECL